MGAQQSGQQGGSGSDLDWSESDQGNEAEQQNLPGAAGTGSNQLGGQGSVPSGVATGAGGGTAGQGGSATGQGGSVTGQGGSGSAQGGGTTGQGGGTTGQGGGMGDTSTM